MADLCCRFPEKLAVSIRYGHSSDLAHLLTLPRSIAADVAGGKPETCLAPTDTRGTKLKKGCSP